MAFYLADHFRASIFCCSDGSVTDTPEFIMAEIIFNDRFKLLLAVVYRPPNLGYLNKFFQYSIILGDFNADMNRNTFNSQQLGSFIFESSLYLMPFKDKLKEFGQRGVAFLSTHDFIFIRYGIKLQRHEKLIICRDWSGFDAASFQSDVGNIDWTDVSVSNNIDAKIDIYCTKLFNIFNAHVPLKRRYFRNLPAPWLRHLGLIKARDIGGRFSHSVEELNAFFEDNAVHADYVEDDSLRDILERNFDDRSFHWNYVMPRGIMRVISLSKSNAHLFNFSLMNGVFPVKWKSTCPIPKVRNPTLDPCQSAYRNNHSTQTCLIKMLDEVRYAADHPVTVSVFFDFLKAFDRVNHFLLIKKNLNFSENVLRWINSYLTEHTQAVKDCIKGTTSSSSLVRVGVPQGSVLGPLLFTLYLADFSHVVRHCKYNFYADDLQTYIHCEPRDLFDTIRKVNEDIDEQFLADLVLTDSS
ncbi:hypothetical protein ACFW04_013909 [Cataglyphis niger]